MKWVKRLIKFCGEIASWSGFILVLLICIGVTLRYLFGINYMWLSELQAYFFAAIFMLGGAYAFEREKHVRVDVFYDKWSERRKALVDFIGTIVFLLPWTWIMMQVGVMYFYNSWKIGESSNQVNGLPAVYIFKSLIFICFLLLFAQAIIKSIESFQTLQKTTNR